MQKILGAYPTMITPYHEDGSVDYETVKKYVHWYHDNGVQAFLQCASPVKYFI